MDKNICWGEAKVTYSDYRQFVSVPTDERWGNGHKLNYRKFYLNIRKKKSFVDDLTQEQVAGLVCEICSLEKPNSKFKI